MGEAATPPARDRGFGVYLHWPWCARICGYCDFNVYKASGADGGAMLDAMLADLAGHRERLGPRRVDSLFFGGGTPSLMTGADAARLITAVDRLWGFAPDAEITLEANPEDAGRLAEHAAAGVNRVSLGVQALDDARLAFLTRRHDAAAALAAVAAARPLFASLSLDLIYATPGQGTADWSRELAAALSLPVDHLSLYELTLEPATAFGRAAGRGRWTPMADEPAADLYELTQEVCDRAGLPAYEISNHARSPGRRSRHNLIYWRGGEWVGVGPGAHGRIELAGARLATEAAVRPADYCAKVAAAGVGWAGATPLAPLDQARERVAMGLRWVEGFAPADLAALGLSLDAAGLDEAVGLGLAETADGAVRLTRRGRLVADRVAAMISP